GGGAQVEGIVKKARRGAEGVSGKADAQAADILKQASQNVQKQMEQSFADALLAGVGEVTAGHVKAVSRSIRISIGRRLFTFNGKSYMQFSIQNNSAVDFTYTAVSVQITSGDETKAIPFDVFQTKSENKVNK